MTALKQMQQSFMGCLFGRESNIIDQIEATPDATSEQRLSVYTSGYRLRLKEALSTDYERLHGYLGD